MKPAIATTTEHNALEDLGRATLQIVHDLKNQLNGLKLYATFLRKRLEREDRSTEERETVLKLIAGLDRAARDMTALVRYSRPVELNRQPNADLKELISRAVKEVSARPGAQAALACEIESGPLYGEFDAAALAEALQVLTDEAVNSLPPRNAAVVSLHAHRAADVKSAEAVIEWRGIKPAGRNHSLRSSESHGTVYTALAARIIEAHGGRFECDPNTMRAWLPLSE
jgi:nitrogen fixation/metabolism regulation signal transduction histidine kinase